MFYDKLNDKELAKQLKIQRDSTLRHAENRVLDPTQETLDLYREAGQKETELVYVAFNRGWTVTMIGNAQQGWEL